MVQSRSKDVDPEEPNVFNLISLHRFSVLTQFNNLLRFFCDQALAGG